MKVSELIKKLEIYNQDFEVRIEKEQEKDEVFSTEGIVKVGAFTGSESIIFISKDK